ncbi:hypothetical protein GGX14DRAFT_577829 [Mycena pura]|uniref:Uncharacterized protein n=1 Tax=Mycena pura TaxID=153505 RepID=A0AAD6UQU3_9AGAR|nr:hypothetical protein GGX14DRAFT_577829 [Mycena pura]
MAVPLSPFTKVTGLIFLFTLALLLTPRLIDRYYPYPQAAPVAAACTTLARGFALFVLINAAHQLFSLLFRETVLLARVTAASPAALEAGTGTGTAPLPQPTPRPITFILGPIVLRLCSLLVALVISSAAWRPESEDPVLMKRPPLVAVGAGAVYYLRRIDVSFLGGVVVGLALAMGLTYMALTFGLFGDALWAITVGVDEEESDVRVPLLFEEGGAIDGADSEQGKEGKAV